MRRSISLALVFFTIFSACSCGQTVSSASLTTGQSDQGISTAENNTGTANLEYVSSAQEQEQQKPTREPDVIFVPTPQEVVDKMLEMAQVKKSDLVYDLGCGDGRIVVTAAKKYGCRAVGYDINPQRVKESKDNVAKNNVGDLVTIKQEDIFTLDLSDANVITLYLLPSLNVKLIPQLEKLKPGSRIVSHDFDMEGVIPDQIVTVPGEGGYVEHTVYLWTTPLKKAGQESPAETVVKEPVQETRTPDVVYVPTPQEVVDMMLQMAKVKKDDVVYDLGCGDGRIVVTAAKNYGCKAFGYDIDPQRIKESRENVAKNNVGSLVTITQKDIFTLDLSDANVVTLYLLPRLNVKLIPQLEKLKPGSRIVSHDFDMTGVVPDRIVNYTPEEGGVSHRIYLWTTPLKKEGNDPPVENITGKPEEAAKIFRQPDVIFVPTPQDVVDKMLELAQVKKDDLVYDLGCGDGRIVVTAAKKYGCKAVGYDIDPQRIKESKENVAKNNVGDLVTIKQEDIFTLDLSDADVITLYLLPSLNVKLIPQLEKLKPGARIVSHSFAMEGITPDKVISLKPSDSDWEHTVYLWTAPIQKEQELRDPDVIFVPTPQNVVDKMLEMAQVKKTDLLYDLGCGDGRIVVTAAKEFGCKAVGYDIDPQRIKESKENVEKNNVGDLVTIKQEDIFTLDLSDADVITLYLLPSLNVKLIPQLEKLKPGSRIVSHDFDMKGVIPDEVVTITPGDIYGDHRVYLWTTPLKKEN
jgi:cyclopropane fatty-acyl-phospholipid synthase-like methyltransferase